MVELKGTHRLVIVPICFLGDFCQLEPIQGKCIYTNLCGLYLHQALNCMVELKVTHRFSNCSDYKRIMTIMREGILTDEDRDILNGRVIDNINVRMPDSAKVRYATFFKPGHMMLTFPWRKMD